jgi:thiol reductant ABC exporter CydC subunit
MVRAFALGRAVFRYLERLIGHDAAFRGLTGLRLSVYDRLERLAPVGLARFSRGDLLTRLVGDVDAALDLPLRVVLPWLQAALTAAVTIAVCVWLVPSAGLLIGALAVVAITAAPWIVGSLAARAERTVAPTRAMLAAAVVEGLGATGDILANGSVTAVSESVHRVDDHLTSLAQRSSVALGIGGGITNVLQGAAVVGALVLTVPQVANGSIDPVWLAVIALVPLALFEVTGTLPAASLALNRVRGSAGRLAAVEDQPDPVRAPARPRAIPNGPTTVEVRDLAASWNRDGERVTVHGISFAIAAGERLWIVGPSGAGKSTIAAVLLGFLDYRGSARCNGVEIREADGDAVRSTVSLLTQRSHVFDTTIGQNITLGRVPTDDPQVMDAAQSAQLDLSRQAFPDGLDTTVGSFGATVSGGEAQRIALARLLLDPRPVLVLDEPTEHLDAQTAEALSRTLREATVGSTTIVITHRVSDIPRADPVLVLRDGTVEAHAPMQDAAHMSPWLAERLADERSEADMAALIADLEPGVARPTGRA